MTIKQNDSVIWNLTTTFYGNIKVQKKEYFGNSNSIYTVKNYYGFPCENTARIFVNNKINKQCT